MVALSLLTKRSSTVLDSDESNIDAIEEDDEHGDNIEESSCLDHISFHSSGFCC